MKIIKGSALLFFLIAILGSCFDPPEYSNVPEIEYNNIEFIAHRTIDESDSINVYIDFKDGDGDLGIDDNDQLASTNFYFIESGGVLTKITPTVVKSGDGKTSYNILDIPGSAKLVSFKSRNRLTQLPDYDCEFYDVITPGKNFLISENDLSAFEAPKKTFADTLTSSSGETYYKFTDTLYIEKNQDIFNYFLEVLVREPQDPNADPEGYIVYDGWECGSSLNGRFPLLSSKESSPIEGTLKYALVSADYRLRFSIKPMKLRIQIKDRAQNVSNIIETPEFTLDGIRK